MTSRPVTLLLLAGSAACLIAMVVVAMTTGATQEAYEYVTDPEKYVKSLVDHASGVRLIFALDVAFIIFYTGFFAALAAYLKRLGRPFAYLALGCMLLTGFLDIVEDHRILSMLSAAEHGARTSLDWLQTQQILSSTKFTVSYVALFLFGLAIPRTTKLGWALALFLTLGNVATAIASYAAAPAMREQLDSGRWIGFLVGFCVAALWLRRAPEPGATSG